jgi:ABC-type sugar transport system ATPase subunit
VVEGGKVLLGPNKEDSQVRVDNIPDETRVYLSFRSESVILDNSSPLRAKVVMTSVMGKEIITSFILAGKEVRGYMNSDVELHRDEEIGIRFKNTGVFVFDYESGERYL